MKNSLQHHNVRFVMELPAMEREEEMKVATVKLFVEHGIGLLNMLKGRSVGKVLSEISDVKLLREFEEQCRLFEKSPEGYRTFAKRCKDGIVATSDDAWFQLIWAADIEANTIICDMSSDITRSQGTVPHFQTYAKWIFGYLSDNFSEYFGKVICPKIKDEDTMCAIEKKVIWGKVSFDDIENWVNTYGVTIYRKETVIEE